MESSGKLGQTSPRPRCFRVAWRFASGLIFATPITVMVPMHCARTNRSFLRRRVMKNNRGMIAGTLLTLTTVLGVGAGAALQEQGAGQRAGSKLDDAGRSIKQGLRGAGDAIRNQFAKARDS